MKNQDYTTTIKVESSAANAFDAIKNVSGWWSTDMEGQTSKQNEIFTVRFGEVYITSKVVELIAEKKLVWEVLDCDKPWLKNTKEWVGTKMSWEISESGQNTLVHFTHIGLAPEIECFDVCKNAWSKYIDESLYNLITKGEGKPTKIETETKPRNDPKS